MGFHGNQIGDMVPILLAKDVLLTFQMEQNGTFLDNFKYDYWIPYSVAPFPLGWSHIPKRPHRRKIKLTETFIGRKRWGNTV